MKKILNLIILFGIVASSCSNEDLLQKEELSVVKQRQGGMFDYIEAISIGNRTDCENNILVFPSWEKYKETIEMLEKMKEDYCDSFEAGLPRDVTEEEYDVLADAVGFDEDDILLQFENDLRFCSLRKKIEVLETAWLELQGDGEWNADEDPDNHFIDDTIERTLLSENAEVIIKDEEGKYVYYKLLDDDGSRVEIHDDMEAVEKMINGIDVSDNPNVFLKNNVYKYVDGPCRGNVTNIAYYYGPNGTRIKQVDKVRKQDDWGGESKIKAKTKGYRWIRKKWRNRKTTIVAGINAYNINSSGYITKYCWTSKDIFRRVQKYRKEVVVKYHLPKSQGASIEVQNNSAYGFHSQSGALYINLDFYDNQP